MNKNKPYIPPIYLRNPMVQTLLSSSSLRKQVKNEMIEQSKEIILEVDDGVKLQGFYSKHTKTSGHGLVILMHGWEGNHNSSYIQATGKTLFDHGFNIFRLNLRDHGESHHLNRGLFLGTLIDESFQAIQSISKMYEDNFIYIVGFSMGGNFAIRISHRCSFTPIPNLKQIVAINPPMDPLKATVNIDKHTLIRSYFLKKWKRSLKIKQRLYPRYYDFSEIMNMKNCMDITESLLIKHSPYSDSSDYFGRYTLTKGYLDSIHTPTWILTSEDDPIIPVDDFLHTQKSKYVKMTIHKYGGHCGYLTGVKLHSWYQEELPKLFKG